MLNEGSPLLRRETVREFTKIAVPARRGVSARTLGWEALPTGEETSSAGSLFGPRSYGHTGWTGPSLWIDPITRTFVIFLANRVHPDGKGDVVKLRGRIATVVAAALADAAPPPGVRLVGGDFGANPAVVPPPRTTAPVLNGIDVLSADQFAILRGKRVGLVTNHTGRARDGSSTIDVLRAAPGVTLVSLFSPEHGIRGILDASVPSTTDEKTGLPIHSLYGATERPTPEMLAGLDAVVIDVQDIGTRFYTYITSMAYMLEAAAPRKIKVFVLDRPNPIGGVQIEGPALDPGATSYIGYFPAMPIRHSLTLGEIAQLFNGEKKIGADLTVIKLRNWRRDAWFDETSQPLRDRAVALAEASRHALRRERHAPGGHRHEDELQPERAEDRGREHVAEREHSSGRHQCRRRIADLTPAPHEEQEGEDAADEEERGVPLAAAKEADVRPEQLLERARVVARNEAD